MGLDYQLMSSGCNFAEEASKGSLGTGVEVDFRLLKQEQICGICTKHFRNYRKNLADAVTYVYKVVPQTLSFALKFSDLQLEGIAGTFAQTSYINLIKKPGIRTKMSQ